MDTTTLRPFQLVHRLDIERADCRQISFAERGPDISAQQAFIASGAFLTQTRLRHGPEPAIQVFVQRDWCALHPATKVAITEHLLKVGLGMPDGAADNPAVVAPFADLAAAPEELRTSQRELLFSSSFMRRLSDGAN